MKTLISLLLFLSYFFLSSSCQMENGHKKLIHVFCDKFPELRIDSISTDTIGFRKYLQDEFAENKSDSIHFIIECPDNIVFRSVIQTENILKEQISLFENKGTCKITIYNKCLSEFSQPLDKKNKRPADLVVKADSNGKLSIDNQPMTIDSICDKYRGQNVTIEVIADDKLSIEKFSEILKRLEMEHFKLLLGQ